MEVLAFNDIAGCCGWLILIILASERLRQEDCLELKASLGNKVKPCLKLKTSQGSCNDKQKRKVKWVPFIGPCPGMPLNKRAMCNRINERVWGAAVKE